MHKFNYFCSIVLMITLPLALILLSTNVVLRVSATYGYHFNDSQVVDEIPYQITGSQLSKDIASYLSSFDDEAFQSYEENGTFRDPVFDETEQSVMKKAKTVLAVSLFAGLLCLLVTVVIYIYLWRNGFIDALRNRSRVGLALACALLIAHGVCWCRRGCRLWLYEKCIGIPLEKDSTLAILLGDPAFKTYVIFASVFGAGLLALAVYINHQLTKPTRIFS